MKVTLLTLFCCAVCSLPVLGQAGSAAAGSDQKFVDFAAQTDMLEAHLGQLAADQAAGSNVKDYAQMLVTDHTSDYNAVSAAAAKAGLTVPKGLDAAHDKMIAQFSKLKGRAFDQRYEREMVAGHQKAIAEYKKEAASGTSADLKAYANQTLPTLEKHLDGAKDLMKPAAKAKKGAA
ncbi:MAG: DUF4142 domain-containing protein [Acidobacteriaceae bacterium]|nr:DUF4142 domain-containing protein [Acidobacteriaceae bacterium]MBV9778539.1 DUF4142 domain-containing protein [Acidobacteriaceae bacterium]